MSIWEMRRAIEQAIPWWAPWVLAVVVIAANCIWEFKFKRK